MQQAIEIDINDTTTIHDASPVKIFDYHYMETLFSLPARFSDDDVRLICRINDAGQERGRRLGAIDKAAEIRRPLEI